MGSPSVRALNTGRVQKIVIFDQGLAGCITEHIQDMHIVQ